jgi:hypothetical protein
MRSASISLRASLADILVALAIQFQREKDSEERKGGKKIFFGKKLVPLLFFI